MCAVIFVIGIVVGTYKKSYILYFSINKSKNQSEIDY